jgi:N6-adenosine-specific RNA methylase IME4
MLDVDWGKLEGNRYQTILADPPWQFDTWSDKGKGRSAERHYPTLDINMLCEMPVGRLYATDCTLFLWATWPRLDEALRLIKRWGFTYKTLGFIWVKTTKDGLPMMGTGFWTRANSEPCLLATHGRPRRFDRGVSQVVLAPRGRHSAKPPEVRTRIQRLVEGPYAELFARERAPGWDAWGDEV